MNIRKATKKEIPELVTLHEKAIFPIWDKLNRKHSKEGVQKYLEKTFDEQEIFVAEENKKIIGCSSITIKDFGDYKEGEIGIVLVNPEFQKKGIGHAIMTFLEKYAKKKGAKKLVLDVLINNPAVGFYEKIGFDKIKYLMYKEIK